MPLGYLAQSFPVSLQNAVETSPLKSIWPIDFIVDPITTGIAAW
jgi:hypothetical protein